MAYPLLHLAHLLFNFPFGFQIAVTRNPSDLLLDGSLHFVETAREVVFRAGFHISRVLLASGTDARRTRPRKARIAALLSLFEGCHFCKSRDVMRSEQN
jgi:hypothetical protein